MYLKDKHKNLILSLNEREIEVLKILALGNTNHEIASQLNLSVHTVKVYVANILQKLEVEHRTHAAVIAICENIVDF